MILDKKPNVQIYPNKQRIVPNCKLVKIISNLSEKKYTTMVVDGDKRRMLEVKNHKKFGDILTTYRLVNKEDCDGSDPLTEFDRAVLSVCISEWEMGNRYTTPAIILRGLTGKVGLRHTGKGKIHKDQHTAIINSVKKMMGIILEIDLSDTNQKLNYHDGKQQKITSAILPAYFVSTSINGQPIEDDVIFFDRESPIMEIARDRKQLLTFDATLLDVPKQNNTPMNITIKNYVLTRILEIKLHKLQSVITFDDVFKKCRIENSSRKTKMDARNILIKFFEHLKSKGKVNSFEVTKKANSFHSIKFSYSTKKPATTPKRTKMAS